jgi:hypothetical protein
MKATQVSDSAQREDMVNFIFRLVSVQAKYIQIQFFKGKSKDESYFFPFRVVPSKVYTDISSPAICSSISGTLSGGFLILHHALCITAKYDGYRTLHKILSEIVHCHDQWDKFS